MRISDLVNKVEPFRFEFDGAVLEGTYYKYKTTTPTYAREMLASLPSAIEDGTDEEKDASIRARDEALAKAGLKAVTDTIITWNAEDDQGNALAPSVELFDSLPKPFTDKFFEFFDELRKGNPTNGNGLPVG